MIEEIRELMPLLSQMTNGAMWGVGLYFGLEALKVALWGAFGLGCALAAYRIFCGVIDINRPDPAKIREIKVVSDIEPAMTISGRTDGRVVMFANMEAYRDLMRAVAREDDPSSTAFIDSSDIRRAVDILKRARD